MHLQRMHMGASLASRSFADPALCLLLFCKYWLSSCATLFAANKAQTATATRAAALAVKLVLHKTLAGWRSRSVQQIPVQALTD